MQVAVDGNGNIKPMKNKSIEKIDLTVAEINAMAIAMLKENEASVYERRGMSPYYEEVITFEVFDRVKLAFNNQYLFSVLQKYAEDFLAGNDVPTQGNIAKSMLEQP